MAKMLGLPKNVSIDALSITLSQPSDSCQEHNSEQTIVVETDDAGAGKFIVLKTDRWAIDGDEIDAFAKTLKQIIALAEKE